MVKVGYPVLTRRLPNAATTRLQFVDHDEHQRLLAPQIAFRTSLPNP
jgi:hypothetical protein